jgi:hypothetical protein
MSVLMIDEILNQAGKITVLHVTGGVRPQLEHVRVVHRMYHRLRTGFLSKNALFRKHLSVITPFIRGGCSLPAT